ncbi:unnamed protein product [Bursaphelenchus xylophilus]|uniref:(pine wood nematode) hypothetical protein n=1 Tax=Bursaphelenchus xylophilus TaxID=6326 RepID=A0A1I7SCH0_BURXY|nr:unnamed protein product [Bursaphelenchus xylophilus]CAG9094111.1 unnamed protein product [Bursaphelenchus xylophilus]
MVFEELWIPTEGVIRVYHGIEYGFMAINLCLLTLTTYAIVKTPVTYLSIYRYFLLHEIIWSFAFDFSMCIFIPILHLPHVCYQSSGFLSDILNSSGHYFFIYALVALVGGKAYSILLCCFHRHMLAHRHTRHYWQILNPLADFRLPHAFLFYGVIYVVIVVATWITIFAVVDDPVAATAQLQASDSRVRTVLAHFPHTTCLVASKQYEYILLIPIMILVVWGFGIAALLCSMLIVLKTNPKAYMSTIRLQWTLYRSLLAQLGATLVFMYLPLLIWLVVGLLDANYGMLVGVICMSLLAMHSSVDCVVILIYVKPFRRAIQRIFNSQQQDTVVSKATRSPGSPTKVKPKPRSESVFAFPPPANFMFTRRSLPPITL